MPGITVNSDMQVIYTPRGTGAVAQTFQLKAGHGQQPSRYDDGPLWNKATAITQGGKAFTVIHDVFDTLIVRIESVYISHNLPGSPLWAELQNWWAHAASGGLFNINLSRERVGPFTLTSGASQGILTINPGTDPTVIPNLVKENDTLMFEDADDPTLVEYVIASADGINTPANAIAWKPALSRDYSNNSKVRFADTHINCLALQDKFPLKRRAAKAGPFVWDFQLLMRTTRP
jgi:hypothetical protein